MTTPEEEFNKNVWEVLGEIESERLQTLKGKPVEYKFPVRQVVGPGIISQETEKKILYKLQEWGALKIRENPWEPPESTPYLFYLDLNIKEYKKIYRKYQKICDIDAYLNEYQNKLYKGKKPPEFLHIPDADVSKLALRPTSVHPKAESVIREATAKDIADMFSERNYNFVLMVLEGIANAYELGTGNKLSYQLQSPPGPELVKERSLIKKFENYGFFKNMGEDGIFGIASLSEVNIDFIEDVISEIKKKIDIKPRENNFDSASTKVYSLKENILFINGKKVIFKRDTLKLSLLKMLTEKPKGFYYNEETEELIGSAESDPNKVKNSCYEGCRGIANRLAKEGIVDFIQFDFNQAKINSSYTKTS